MYGLFFLFAMKNPLGSNFIRCGKSALLVFREPRERIEGSSIATKRHRRDSFFFCLGVGRQRGSLRC